MSHGPAFWFPFPSHREQPRRLCSFSTATAPTAPWPGTLAQSVTSSRRKAGMWTRRSHSQMAIDGTATACPCGLSWAGRRSSGDSFAGNRGGPITPSRRRSTSPLPSKARVVTLVSPSGSSSWRISRGLEATALIHSRIRQSRRIFVNSSWVISSDRLQGGCRLHPGEKTQTRTSKNMNTGSNRLLNEVSSAWSNRSANNTSRNALTKPTCSSSANPVGASSPAKWLRTLRTNSVNVHALNWSSVSLNRWRTEKRKFTHAKRKCLCFGPS